MGRLAGFPGCAHGAVRDPQRGGAAEQVALDDFAARGLQKGRLVLGLDAFGDGVDAERPRQADDG